MRSKDRVLVPESATLQRMARIGMMCTVPAVLGACVQGDRERFFASRDAVVPCREGDGSARVAMWPSPGGLNPALAAAQNGRANDSVLPE